MNLQGYKNAAGVTRIMRSHNCWLAKTYAADVRFH